MQRHHLYARFVTMALFDVGLVGFEEPFPRVRLGGFIVYRGAKMSKSRGNVVTPDEFLQRVDGKARHLRLPAKASEAEVVGAARSSQRAATSPGGRAARRVVFVPGWLVNFVTEGSKHRPGATGEVAPPRAIHSP